MPSGNYLSLAACHKPRPLAAGACGHAVLPPQHDRHRMPGTFVTAGHAPAEIIAVQCVASLVAVLCGLVEDEPIPFAGACPTHRASPVCRLVLRVPCLTCRCAFHLLTSLYPSDYPGWHTPPPPSQVSVETFLLRVPPHRDVSHPHCPEFESCTAFLATRTVRPEPTCAGRLDRQTQKTLRGASEVNP